MIISRSSAYGDPGFNRESSSDTSLLCDFCLLGMQNCNLDEIVECLAREIQECILNSQWEPSWGAPGDCLDCQELLERPQPPVRRAGRMLLQRIKSISELIDCLDAIFSQPTSIDNLSNDSNLESYADQIHLSKHSSERSRNLGMYYLYCQTTTRPSSNGQFRLRWKGMT